MEVFKRDGTAITLNYVEFYTLREWMFRYAPEMVEGILGCYQFCQHFMKNRLNRNKCYAKFLEAKHQFTERTHSDTEDYRVDTYEPDLTIEYDSSDEYQTEDTVVLEDEEAVFEPDDEPIIHVVYEISDDE